MDHSQLDAWRVFRILAEFVEGFETMTNIGPSVTIFGSTRAPRDGLYYKWGVELAEKIAKKGFAIITGAGPGLMEAANKGAQNVKGRSCGINVSLSADDSNPYIDHKYALNFNYFFVRKVMFVRYAQAFVFLPGGFGTLDELFEVLTLIQTKKIRPIPVFLIGTEYWKGLLDWLNSTVCKAEHLSDGDVATLKVTDDLDAVANEIEAYAKTSGAAPAFELNPKNDKS